MAATYDYKTGNIERDFLFVKWNTKCKGSGLPCKAGSDRCQKCEHYGGSIHPWNFGPGYGGRLDDSYVLCKYPEAKDSEDCGMAKHLYYERLKDKALCALCC